VSKLRLSHVAELSKLSSSHKAALAAKDSDVEQLRKEITAKATEVVKLQAQETALQTDAEAAEARVKESALRLSAVEGQLASEEEGRRTAEASVRELSRVLEESRRSEETRVATMAAAETERNSQRDALRFAAESKCEAARVALANAEEELTSLKTQLEEAKLAVAASNKRYEAAAIELESTSHSAAQERSAAEEQQRLAKLEAGRQATTLAEVQAQRDALQGELARAYARGDDVEAKFQEADGERRAFRGESRELRSSLQDKQHELDAQLLVIHNKDQELQRLRAELADHSKERSEAIARQLRLALSSVPPEAPCAEQRPFERMAKPALNRTPREPSIFNATSKVSTPKNTARADHGTPRSTMRKPPGRSLTARESDGAPLEAGSSCYAAAAPRGQRPSLPTPAGLSKMRARTPSTSAPSEANDVPSTAVVF
jgi:DNA repair exonuclease SbcCD ATPase subunit